MNDSYKLAILTVCTPVEKVPLEMPPSPETDDEVTVMCPQCGGTDPVVQMVDNASVAKCPDCEHEFTPMLESLSRRAIKVLNERNRRRRRHSSFKRQIDLKKEIFGTLGV